MNEETPEWVIDYDAIIAAHLELQPSRVWPGLRFAIPMTEEEWWGFPRMPGWKYEWDVRLGSDTEIRPFGPHYRIPVERRATSAPCEVRSVKWKDVAALKAAFTEAFNGYTDYLYCKEKQLLKLGSAVLRDFFALGKDSLCRRASCLAVDPENPARVIGAALLAPANRSVRRPPEVATQLQPVFIVPGWQRRGVATALVAEVLRRLWEAGQETLISGCSDYNAVSKRFHESFGASEEQRYWAQRPLFYWARNEIWRREHLNKTKGIPFEPREREKLEQWLMSLADELDELEAEESYPDGSRPKRKQFREEAGWCLGWKRNA
jgi:RimJ/RimL family protein N-acetyltransferase